MNIIISNSNNSPIYQQIYTQLKNCIVSNELKAGDMLPSIRALAKDLRISVITTKRAYEELEREGYINTVAGKGCYVSEKNIELIREEHLKKIEDYMQKILELSSACNLSETDLINMLHIIYKGE